MQIGQKGTSTSQEEEQVSCDLGKEMRNRARKGKRGQVLSVLVPPHSTHWDQTPVGKGR